MLMFPIAQIFLKYPSLFKTASNPPDIQQYHLGLKYKLQAIQTGSAMQTPSDIIRSVSHIRMAIEKYCPAPCWMLRERTLS